MQGPEPLTLHFSEGDISVIQRRCRRSTHWQLPRPLTTPARLSGMLSRRPRAVNRRLTGRISAEDAKSRRHDGVRRTLEEAIRRAGAGHGRGAREWGSP